MDISNYAIVFDDDDENKNVQTLKIRGGGATEGKMIVVVTIVLFIGFIAFVCIIIVFFLKKISTIENLMNRTLESLIKRQFKVSLNVENNLVNKITIGTNLGDFVACMYNAHGVYNSFNNKIELSLYDVWEGFTYWAANNDYQNVMFTKANYNNMRYGDKGMPAAEYVNQSYKLHTLPCYLGSVPIPENDNKIWGEEDSYGYAIKYNHSTSDPTAFYNNDTLIIEKLNDKYTLLELDKTKFSDYKNKFFTFLYRNHQDFINVIKELAKSGTAQITTISLDTLYKYYKLFILVTKVEKDIFSCRAFTLPKNKTNAEIVTEENIKKNPKWASNLAFWIANDTKDYKNGCKFTMNYRDADNKEHTGTFYCSYSQKESTISFAMEGTKI